MCRRKIEECTPPPWPHAWSLHWWTLSSNVLPSENGKRHVQTDVPKWEMHTTCRPLQVPHCALRAYECWIALSYKATPVESLGKVSQQPVVSCTSHTSAEEDRFSLFWESSCNRDCTRKSHVDPEIIGALLLHLRHVCAPDSQPM